MLEDGVNCERPAAANGDGVLSASEGNSARSVSLGENVLLVVRDDGDECTSVGAILVFGFGFTGTVDDDVDDCNGCCAVDGTNSGMAATCACAVLDWTDILREGESELVADEVRGGDGATSDDDDVASSSSMAAQSACRPDSRVCMCGWVEVRVPSSTAATSDSSIRARFVCELKRGVCSLHC